MLASGLAGCAPVSLVGALLNNEPEPQTECATEPENPRIADAAQRLRAEFSEGPWQLPAGGNLRESCTNTPDVPADYFWGSWTTAPGVELPADAQSAVAELRVWLETDGWNELEEFTFTEESLGVNAFGVSGSYPELGIYEMQFIYYFEGDIEQDSPHAVLDIDTDCVAAEDGGATLELT